MIYKRVNFTVPLDLLGVFDGFCRENHFTRSYAISQAMTVFMDAVRRQKEKRD